MRSKELLAVYSGGLIQGITLVAFPAASTVFTNPHVFNLSTTAYGSLFLPQAILSIIASWFSTRLTQIWGLKTIFLIGLFANLVSMSLLTLSSAFTHSPLLVYWMLMFATASLGIGFGLTIPTLNTLAALLRPTQLNSAILVLNALLGVGTALAPIFIAIFIGLGFWWGLPLSLILFLCLLTFFSYPLTLPEKNTEASSSQHSPIPVRFWIFALFALLYGIVETLNGNWVSIYMKTFQDASTNLQSLALTAFWGVVTLGRVFFAWTERFLREEIVYQCLPFVIAAAFIIISLLEPNHEYLSLFAFSLAGLGCSALLPLTISFGNIQLTQTSGSAAGGIIAFYLMGYGIAAFGAGSLQDMAAFNLKEIYALGAFIAIILGCISSIINKNYAVKQKETV